MRSITNKIRRRIMMWRGVGEAFSAEGFERRTELKPDYEVLAHALLDNLDFESVFDVGCANGFLVEPFLRAGKNARGIELSPDVREILTPELNLRIDVGDFSAAKGVWDLICCVEVAEHLPPDRSPDLVLKLTKLARKYIFFTAAPPGQSGHGHVNCRPMEDWLAWFKQRGWQSNVEKTGAVRACLDDIHVARWLIGNSLVLEPTSS